MIKADNLLDSGTVLASIQKMMDKNDSITISYYDQRGNTTPISQVAICALP
jgi:hypothetical protein